MKPTHPLGAPAGRALGSITLVCVAAVCALIFPEGADASGRSACSKWGHHGPAQLTRKHARLATTCFINRARRNHGRGRLHQNRHLIEAARRHSTRMANTGCFSHQCPGESSALTRIQRAGYFRGATRWAYAENIAWGRYGRGSPRRIVRGWMHSSGHRANILSRNYRDIGVGFDNNGSRGYYTADFGIATG